MTYLNDFVISRKLTKKRVQNKKERDYNKDDRDVIFKLLESFEMGLRMVFSSNFIEEFFSKKASDA